MGLDTSHDAWHGSYGAFMRWRRKLAEVAGLPPLELMEYFYEPLDAHRVPTLYHGPNTQEKAFATQRYMDDLDTRLPIKWECLIPNPLHELLYHSDCDGELSPTKCLPIADELEKLIPLLPNEDEGGHIGNWRKKTQTFVDGLRLAAEENKPLEFH